LVSLSKISNYLIVETTKY